MFQASVRPTPGDRGRRAWSQSGPEQRQGLAAKDRESLDRSQEGQRLHLSRENPGREELDPGGEGGRREADTTFGPTRDRKNGSLRRARTGRYSSGRGDFPERDLSSFVTL